jgi:hypothetical protein
VAVEGWTLHFAKHLEDHGFAEKVAYVIGDGGFAHTATSRANPPAGRCSDWSAARRRSAWRRPPNG